MSGSPALVSSETFGFVTDALWATETLAAAMHLGVLESLDRGWVDADDLATAHGMTSAQGHLLLQSLVALGLARSGAPSGFTSSMPDVPTLVRRFLPSGRLLRVLQGEAGSVSADTTDGSASLYPEMVAYLASGFRDAATVAASRLARPGLRVLDLGAGAAPWSIALVECDDSIGVVALDLPEVIAVTRRAVEDRGLGDSFEYLAGDFFEVDPGAERYDLVVAGGVLHLFAEDDSIRLLVRIVRTLAPGGTLAIMEPLPDEDFAGPRSVLLYALNLATRTSAGGVYPFSTYARWVRTAGLTGVDCEELSASPPVSMITARREIR